MTDPDLEDTQPVKVQREIHTHNLRDSVVIQGDNNSASVQNVHNHNIIINNFVRTSENLESTKCIQRYQPIEGLKEKLENLSFTWEGTAELINLTFISIKWGFQVGFSVPWDMKCGTLLQIIGNGLQLEDHIDLMGEDIDIGWEIETVDGKACVLMKSLRDMGLKDGDTIYIRGTVFKYQTLYQKDINNNPVAFTTRPSRQDDWLV